MLVYDCFLFFNELDLLEIRLNELDDVVDKFVLVECTKTFSYKDKELFFDKNKERYSKFLSKIVHVIVSDTPEMPKEKGRNGTFHSRHATEAFQRNCIKRGVDKCNKNDIILISDVDEIINSKSINKLKQLLKNNENEVVTFQQKFYYYYLNGLCMKNNKSLKWKGTVATYYKNFDEAEKLRNLKGKNKIILNEGGWHFSYLGGIEKIILKIESFAHKEFDNDKIKNRERLQKKLSKGKDIFDRNEMTQKYIKIDNSYPEYIVKNKIKFNNLIKSIC